MPPTPGTVFVGEHEFEKEKEREQLEPVSKPILGISIENPKTNKESIFFFQGATGGGEYKIEVGESLELDINDIAKIWVAGKKTEFAHWLAVAP